MRHWRWLWVGLLLWGCDDGAAGEPAGEPPARDARVRSVVDVGRDDAAPDSTIAVEDDAALSPDGGPDDDAAVAPGDDAAVAPGCREGETRPCPEGGTQECKDGTWSLCEEGGGDERCNSADDDGDGTIDEGYPGLGGECTAVVDGCNQAGILVCAEDGAGTRCFTDGGGPEAEVCDGLDNDCDNQVDEGFAGRSCCSEDVHCPVGATCEDGECSAPPAPECATPFDCPFGQQCVNGVCEEAPPPGACVDAFDCFPGQRCEAGRCVDDRGGNCVSDLDCFGFEACFDGVCREPQPGECRDRFDCFGDPCIDGRCQPGACVDEFDCGLFELCIEGMCQEPPPGWCLNDFDCEGNERCIDDMCSGAPRGAMNCEAAVELPAFGQLQGNTAMAPDEHWSGCIPNADGGEVIYTFQFERDADVVVDTNGSDYDTVLSVRTDCADVDTEVACNDDRGGLQSEVAFAAAAGTRYWIIVDGVRGQSGAVTLNFNGQLACAGDEDCDGGVCEGGRCRPPPTCDAAVELAAFGEYRGNTGAQPDDEAPVCGAPGGGELVYTFQFDEPTPIRIDTVGSDYDTLIALRTECRDPASEIACNDDGAGPGSPSEVQLNAAAGTRYFLIVDGFRGATGNAVVNFVGPPADDPDVPRCLEGACEAPQQCVNDVCVPANAMGCESATPFPGFGPVEGSTEGAMSDFVASCVPPAEAPDDAYLFVAPFSGRVRIDTEGSSFDTVLSVLGADCATVLGCDDDGGTGNRSLLRLDVVAGAPYYVVIDGYDRFASGPYRLNFALEL